MSKLKALHTLATNLFTLPTPPPQECTCIRDLLQHAKQQEAQLKVSNGFLQDRAEAAEARVQYYKDKTKRLRKDCRDANVTVQVLKAKLNMQPVHTRRKLREGQTKLDSSLEAVVNVLIGYCIAVLSQFLVFPLFNVHLPLFDHLMIGVYFTVISIVRSYCLRRWFNHRTVRNA